MRIKFLQHRVALVCLVTALLVVQESLAQQPCPAELDYGDCECQIFESDGSVIVSCVGQTNAQIREFFLNAPEDITIQSFQLAPVIEDDLLLIATDLLVGRKARNFIIASCPPGSGTGSLEISVDAFKSSKDSAKTFTIRDCYINSLKWNSFLQGFNQLTTITLDNVQDVQSIQTLPLLPGLNELSITKCTGLGHPVFGFPGINLPALRTLTLDNNVDLTDTRVFQILGALLARSLQQLTLTNTPSVTRVPQNLIKFPGLTTITLSHNSIATIVSVDFAFQNNPDVLLIDLTGNQVTLIEKDAFTKGNYGKAKLKLDDNFLTLFDPYVFMEVLDEMYVSNNGGLVSIAGNDEIKCGECEVTWLIRDNPYYMEFVSGGVCADFGGAPFGEVDPNALGRLCKSFTTTTTTTSTTTTTTTTTTTPTTTTEEPTTTTTEEPTTTTPTTTSTTEEPTTTTPTTTPTTTTPTTTTTKTTTRTTTILTTTGTPDEQLNSEDKTLIYVAIGLVSLILLILIIGLVIMICKKRSQKKIARKSESTNISDDQRRRSLSIDNRNLPTPPPPPPANQMYRSDARNYPSVHPANQLHRTDNRFYPAPLPPVQQFKRYPSTTPAPEPYLQRSKYPNTVVVQGPGRKYYAQSLTGSMVGQSRGQQQQTGKRRSYY